MSGNPSTTVDVGNVTQRQFTGLQAGVTYYFRVKAYSTANLVSAPSAEVSYTPPVPVPVVPTLTSISPTSGPTGGGTTITLAGTNFASGATVQVGGVAATGVTVVSATQVRATTPAGSVGARSVQITNPSGESASLAGAFTYVDGPDLTSVSPTSGPTTGGTTITIAGSSFVPGAMVRVNGVAATGVTFVSATQLRANTPAAAAGTYAVQVTNPDGQAGTLSGAYTYVAAPAITSVSPTSGPIGGGTTIAVSGTAFVPGATVRVNGVAATGVTFVSATLLRANTPAAAAGTYAVQVTNPDGQADTLNGAFTYVVGPGLTSVSPASGPTAGGTTITINGSNFVSGATVRVNGAAATGVTFVSATQLRANTPAAAAGTYAVQVTNPDGQDDTLNSAFTYVGGPAHDLRLAGVRADGRRHHDHDHRHWLRLGRDGAASTASRRPASPSCRRRSCGRTRRPRPPAPDAVQVTNPDGQAAHAERRLHLRGAAPTVTSVSPTSGPTGGGTTITVTGTASCRARRSRVERRRRDRRHVPVRDAGARGDAGRHRGRTERAGHQPRWPGGDAGRRVHLHDVDADADADGRVAGVRSHHRRHGGDAHGHQLRGGRDGDGRRRRGDQRRRRQRHARSRR